jgi:hypothetical protein
MVTGQLAVEDVALESSREFQVASPATAVHHQFPRLMSVRRGPQDNDSEDEDLAPDGIARCISDRPGRALPVLVRISVLIPQLRAACAARALGWERGSQRSQGIFGACVRDCFIARIAARRSTTVMRDAPMCPGK